ncbi:hypothetical protein [Amycolatopsis thermoflava]|uniref:hypothetical protein n=1 Tax=Amycolatopsis thermoflava TaxID=84480 RepID=UPI003F4A8491
MSAAKPGCSVLAVFGVIVAAALYFAVRVAVWLAQPGDAPRAAQDDVMSLAEFANRVTALGAEVHEVPGREPNGDCQYCQEEGRFAEVTVYTSYTWQPVDPFVNEMCRACAVLEIGRDLDAGYDVRAEIPAASAAPLPVREHVPADAIESKEHNSNG